MVDVYRPEGLADALRIRRSTSAVPFSGGTDLMVRWRTSPGVLPEFPFPILLMGHLTELQYIREDEQLIYIGAETTLTDVCRSPVVPKMLSEAVSQMAAPALRNLAVLAGNIGNASPAGDALCALTALDGSVILSSEDAHREVLLDAFMTAPGKTVMGPDEVITEIRIPKRDSTHIMYRKVGTRKANALSKLAFCADASVSDGFVREVRIAIGAAAPVVIRSREIEASCAGMSYEELAAGKKDILNSYAKLIVPIDDQRSTAFYRKRTAMNLLSSFLDSLKED